MNVLHDLLFENVLLGGMLCMLPIVVPSLVLLLVHMSIHAAN